VGRYTQERADGKPSLKAMRNTEINFVALHAAKKTSAKPSMVSMVLGTSIHILKNTFEE
jgi:hypothetical protein